MGDDEHKRTSTDVRFWRLKLIPALYAVCGSSSIKINNTDGRLSTYMYVNLQIVN